MLKKFKEFIKENYETGIFDYDNMAFKLDVKFINNLTDVRIMYMGKYYDDLSINIPGSEELDNDEFYLNPNVDKELIKTLVDQGFIEETENESMAGDKKTKSYKLV